MASVLNYSMPSDGSSVGRLDIQLLRSLLAIARAPTLSSAAAELNIPQPTMSLQMKRLEDRAGKMLFKPGRRGKPLRLSVHGERLVRHAERIIDAYEDAVDFLGMPELSGAIKLGIPDLISPAGLQSVLSRFKSIYEDVELTVIPGNADKLKEMIDSGQIDARICTDEKHADKIQVLWSESFHWVCAKNKAIMSQYPLPVALVSEGEPFRDYISGLLDGGEAQWFEAYTSDCLAKIYTAAAAGQVVAAVPASLINVDVVVLDGENNLPGLGSISFAIYKGDGISEESNKEVLINALSDFIHEKMQKLSNAQYH